MISDMPPNRRCWFTPSAASGITTNVTCSEVRALAACLVKGVSQSCLLSFGIGRSLYLHPHSNVHVAAWDFRRSEKGVAAVASSAGDFDRVASAVRFRCVERDCTALVAVRSVGCPSCLVPAAFEVVRYLGEREGQQRQSRESKFAEHDCGFRVGSYCVLEADVKENDQEAKFPRYLSSLFSMVVRQTFLFRLVQALLHASRWHAIWGPLSTIPHNSASILRLCQPRVLSVRWSRSITNRVHIWQQRLPPFQVDRQDPP